MEPAAATEVLRVFLARHVLSTHSGMAAGTWWRLLWANRFRVDPVCLPRAIALTTMSPAISALGAWERLRYGGRLARVEVQPPIFILGHWRSGTTHLHNLLAQDPRFAFPNSYEVLNPHHFLTTEKRVAPVWSRFLPRTRLIDNMATDYRVPLEDEFGISAATGLSPYMSAVFPRRWAHYERYLTLHDVPADEVERWKEGFLHFVRKLALGHDRPLILKSPPHTARVRLLLEMFPEARFVHIHRDPFAVFVSTRSMLRIMCEASNLQRPDWALLDQRVIDTYREMYEVYFAERALIPPGRLHEVCYEDLERDPVGEVGRIYAALGFPDFAEARPAVERYVEGVRDYEKNRHPELSPALRGRIGEAWSRTFAEWGYAR